MSMNLNDGIAQVIATGGELSIPWDFKISDRSELRVVRTRGTSDEVLVLNSTYTIADNQLNQDLGGIAVLAGSATPAVAGDIYTLLLDTQFARGTSFGSSDFNQSGDLFADVLNNQFDNIVRMCQKLGRDVAKSLKFDETLDIPTATIVAAPVDGELLAFQGTGGDVVGVTLGTIANLSTTFTSLTAGDSLDYNGTNWVNRRHLSSLGSNIASAGTTALGAADSDFVTVTGTTTITSFGTPSTFSRKHVWVVFAGALTLTHNATSLILPTGANIATAAGDVAECVHISGANWRVVTYQRANGSSVLGSAGRVLLSTQSASGSTSIDFVNGSGGVVLDATYKMYELEIFNLIPATDNTEIWLRTSSNAGVSYDNGAGNYLYNSILLTVGSLIPNQNSATQLALGAASLNTGLGANENMNVLIKITNPAFTGGYKAIYSQQFGPSNTGADPQMSQVVGHRLTSSAINALRILMSSGNITSGTFKLYGVL